MKFAFLKKIKAKKQKGLFVVAYVRINYISYHYLVIILIYFVMLYYRYLDIAHARYTLEYLRLYCLVEE